MGQVKQLLIAKQDAVRKAIRAVKAAELEVNKQGIYPCAEVYNKALLSAMLYAKDAPAYDTEDGLLYAKAFHMTKRALLK